MIHSHISMLISGGCTDSPRAGIINWLVPRSWRWGKAEVGVSWKNGRLSDPMGAPCSRGNLDQYFSDQKSGSTDDNWWPRKSGSPLKRLTHTYLVGGIPTPLKNMKVSWDDSSQWKNKKCSKPPTSFVMFPMWEHKGTSMALHPSLIFWGRLEVTETGMGVCWSYHWSRDFSQGQWSFQLFFSMFLVFHLIALFLSILLSSTLLCDHHVADSGQTSEKCCSFSHSFLKHSCLDPKWSCTPTLW